MSDRRSKRIKESFSRKQLGQELKVDKTRSFEYDPIIRSNYSTIEKSNLMKQIKNLSDDQISKINEIIQSNEPTTSKDLKDGINLNRYQTTTINQINIYVDKCLKKNQLIKSLKRDQCDNSKKNQFDNFKRDQFDNSKRDQFDNLEKDKVEDYCLKDQSNYKNSINKSRNNTNKSIKKTKILTNIKQEPIDDIDEYIKSSSAFVNKRSKSCNGYNKLSNNICYVCGLYKTVYKISDAVRNGYEKTFNKIIEIKDYSPSMICGTCRCNLIDANRKMSIRKFKFVEPFIWRRATNHDERSSECDCYFDILNANKQMIKNKIYPENSTCTIPKFDKPIRSMYYSVEEQVNKINLDKEFHVNKSFNLNNNQQNHQQNQQQNSEFENIRPTSRYMSYNTYNSLPEILEFESIRRDLNYIANQMNQIHEGHNAICNRIDEKTNMVFEKNEFLQKKIENIEEKLSLILSQQQIIIQNSAFSLFLNNFTNQQNAFNQSDNNQMDSVYPLNLSRNPSND